MPMQLEFPGEALARALNAADDLEVAADEAVYAARMANVARIVRDRFPTAATVVVDSSQRYEYVDGLRIHGILDAGGMVLWEITGEESNDDYLTADGCGWEEVVNVLEYNLTRALGRSEEQQRWQHDRVHADGWHAGLPTTEDIKAVTSGSTRPAGAVTATGGAR